MKKLLTFLLFVAILAPSFAQTSVKKYVLIEHFTNSNCSTCASRNPAFYNFIDQVQYASEVHHISIHPQYPYSNCVFYQANTAENTARSTYYNVSGTPTLALNGTFIGGGNPLLNATKINPYLNQTSPLHLKVTESGTGSNRSANIKVRSFGTLPQGTYKLYAAIVEKVVNQTTGNNESVHRDVFRKMLPNINGVDFTAAAVGQEIEFNYDYTLSAAWNASQIYIVAFVQNTATKEIVNSGTKFDPALSSGTTDIAVQSLKFQPNPAADFVSAELADDRAVSVEVFASNGSRVTVAFEQQGERIVVPTAALSAGIYYVKIRGEKSIYTAKIVK
jgi:hypothetical protein